MQEKEGGYVDVPGEGEPLPEPPMMPEKRSGGSTGFGSPELVKTALVSLAMALLVVIGMSFMGGGTFVTKKDFETNILGLTDIVNQGKAETTALKTQVTTAIQGIPNTISSQVNSAISNATSNNANQIASLSGQVSALQETLNAQTEKISGLEADMASLQDTVADYEARLSVLEEQQSSTDGDSSSSGVTAKIETQFFDYVSLPRDTITEVIVPLRLKITNNTNVDEEDIQLIVSFEPESWVSLDWAAGYPKLEGSPSLWSMYGNSTYGMVFVNGWGLSLDANTSRTYQLSLFLKVDTALTTDYMWRPVVEVD